MSRIWGGRNIWGSIADKVGQTAQQSRWAFIVWKSPDLQGFPVAALAWYACVRIVPRTKVPCPGEEDIAWMFGPFALR